MRNYLLARRALSGWPLVRARIPADMMTRHRTPHQEVWRGLISASRYRLRVQSKESPTTHVPALANSHTILSLFSPVVE